MHPKRVLSNSMKSARYERSTIRTREESGDTEGPIVDPRLSCMGPAIHVTKRADFQSNHVPRIYTGNLLGELP